MLEKKLAGWNLSFTEKDGITTIKINHDDKSIVSDTESDIGGADELGYRLTTQAIEDDYKANGDASSERIEDVLSVSNWRIELINDEDNHLNIYCINTVVETEAIEQLSLTNGTSHSKSCDIVISDRAY